MGLVLEAGLHSGGITEVKVIRDCKDRDGKSPIVVDHSAILVLIIN